MTLRPPNPRSPRLRRGGSERRAAQGRIALAMLAMLGIGCVVPVGLRAQRPLDEVERDLDAGRVMAAMSDLQAWQAGAAELPPQDRGRLRWLTARATLDADSARRAYLDLAVGERSRYAGEAWLALGKLDLATGQHGEAEAHLERLRADYPSHPRVAESWYWSGRVFAATGRLTDACAAWSRARAAGADGVAAERIESASSVCVQGGLRYTVQVGAFQDRSAADEVVGRASALGFEARVLTTEGLHKVRIGRFTTAATAREMSRRLSAAGFSVLVVADTPE